MSGTGHAAAPGAVTESESLSVLGRQLAGSVTGPVVGVGIDAVEIERFRRILERRSGLALRLFTEGERTYAQAALDPVPRLATRFAAIEATMKALGVGLGAFPFVDVEVVRSGLGAPELVLRGGARALADRAGVRRMHLSLCHTETVALAMVVAEGRTSGSVTDPAPKS